MNGFFQRVYEAVKLVPCGRVTTYGKIAAFLGCPRMSRQVGFALHANPYFGEVPCHRVVNRFGRPAEAFAFGGINMQVAMLEKEGVEFSGGLVDLERFGFDFSEVGEAK